MDRGKTFIPKIKGNITGMDVVDTHPNYVFLCKEDGIYKSTDSGETFNLISTSGFPFKKLSKIKVSPVNINNIVIDNNEGEWNIRTYYSIDGGLTWKQSSFDNKYSFMPYNSRPSMFAWHPKDENVVWSFGGDWATKSSDKGATWEWASNGVNVIVVGGLFNFNTQNPDLIYVASQDYNGAVTTNRGKTWKYINLAELEWGGFVYGAYAATPNVLFAGNADSWGGTRILKITWDGGETITDTGIELAGRHDVSSYGDPTDPNILFCFDHRSVNQGISWSKMSGCDGVITSNPSSKRELYGRNRFIIVKSTDKGATWERVKKLPYEIRDIAYDYVRDRLYASAGDKLYQYDVKTKKLEDITDRIPKDQYGNRRIQTVAVDPTDTDIVYTGGSKGVYATDVSVLRSKDAGKTWEVLTKNRKNYKNYKYGMQGAREAKCMRVHPKTRELFVSTCCHGIWKLSPYK